MVVQELTAAQHAQKAQELLAEADAMLTSGEYDHVSGKLWSAVEHAVVAVAVERGWECDGDDDYMKLLPIVERIEKECRADGITSSFKAATLWHDNRDYHFLDDYEYEFFSPSARRFVSKALSLLE